MAASVSPSRLEVQPNSILFGKFHVPFGNILSARIDPERSEVMLYCEHAISHTENSSITFQLQTDERVKQFIQGLLEKTQAYLLPFVRVSAEVVRSENVAFVRAEFVLTTSEEARNFERYVAPVLFKGSWVSFSGLAVTIQTIDGPEADVVQRTKQAFAALNVHTDNTLRNALSKLDPSSPFCMAPIPAKIPDTHDCTRPPYYVVTPDTILKEVEHVSPGELATYTMEPLSLTE